MALNRTEGYYKAVVSITHLNSKGETVHLMDAQLGQFGALDVFDDGDDGYVMAQALATTCRSDHTRLPEYVRAAIASLERNDYQLTISCYVMC